MGTRGNRLKGEAEFTYEGETFRLSLNNRAWIEAEEVLGISMLDVIDELKATLDAGRNPKIKHMVALMFGGLVQNHPDITEGEVIDMVFSGDAAVKKGLLAAIAGAQPPDLVDDDAGGTEGNAPAPATRAGTGKTSSAPGARPASNRKGSGTKRRAR
ncbi:hypothetical protein V5F89_12470 [Pelagerythrobacter marensis]|uniref:Gene transfer agent family protein n=1 Tax=Pelagerythrobacter marensis TaxID=543877 RepID=A0ABZ2D2F0_9SPHN